MVIVRRFIAVILCITLVPVNAAITTSSVATGEFSDPIFWKNHLNDVNIYNLFHNNPTIQTSLSKSVASDLPITDSTMREFLADAGVKALLGSAGDPIWLENITTQILDEAIPYLGGESESLAIQPELVTRVSPALASLTESTTNAEFFTYIISTEVLGDLGPITLDLEAGDISLPISISNKEILAIVESEETKQWYILTVTTFFDDMESYLEGETDIFSFSLHNQLENLAAIHSPQVTRIIDTKIEQVFSLLPQCSLAQIVTATLTHVTPEAVGYALITSSSRCVPPGVTYSMAKEILDVDLEKEVSDRISEAISEDLLAKEQEDFKDILGSIKCVIHNPPRIDAIAIITTDPDTYDPCISEISSLDEFNKIRTGYLPYIRALQSPWIHGVLILFALLTASIGARTWTGKIRWAGIFSLLTGSLLLAFAVGLQAFAMLIGAESLPTEITEEYPSVSLVTIDLVRNVVRSLSIAILGYSSIVCIGGITLFVIGTILQRRVSRVPSSP